MVAPETPGDLERRLRALPRLPEYGARAMTYRATDLSERRPRVVWKRVAAAPLDEETTPQPLLWPTFPDPAGLLDTG